MSKFENNFRAANDELLLVMSSNNPSKHAGFAIGFADIAEDAAANIIEVTAAQDLRRTINKVHNLAAAG